MTTLRRFDDLLMWQINSFAGVTGWLHVPLVAFARYGVVLFAVLLLSGLLLARSRAASILAAAGWGCIAVLVAVALNQPIGRALHEARPYDTHPQLLVLSSRTTDFSFPSDHAVMAGAAAAALLVVSRRLGLVALAAALLMAFARVYIAAHYPWDVVVGLMLGGAVALLGWLLLAVPLTALTAWLRRQPPLGTVFAERPRRAGTRTVPATRRSAA